MMVLKPGNKFIEDIIKQQAKSNAQISCEAIGGTWDGVKCIRPEPTAPNLPQEPTSEPDARGFDVRRDAETGRLTGFQRPGGPSLVGISPKEVRALATKEANRQEVPVGGAAEASLAATEERRAKVQNQGFDLASRVGEIPSPDILADLKSQITAGNVDYIGALATTVPGILPDLLTGAIAGGGAVFGASAVATAATGGAAAPVAGVTIATAATVLGVVNAVKGVYSDFVSDVKRQKREIIETPIRTLTETKSILNDITGAQNSNPENALDNLEAFNNQLAVIDLEYERLKEETDNDLNKFLGDTGINQLQEYEVYYLTDGERQRQIDDFALALANPDPARIKPSTITLAKIKEAIRKELE